MKRQFISVTVFVIMMLSVIISCEKSKTDNHALSAGAERFIELKTRINAMNASSGQMSNFMSVIGRSQMMEGDLSIDGTYIDSSYVDSLRSDPGGYWEYFTCATVSESDNPDGTHTTVYDYGDGCDEYGSLFRGKLTYIWSNEDNNYYSKVIYEDYYTYGVEMNGTSEYSFTSDGRSYYTTGCLDSSGDSTVTICPVEFNWSGSSSGHEEITMVTDDGLTYYYKSDYSNKWDSVSYTVLTGTYYCKNESAQYNSEYNYTVEEPLITSYICSDTWVPVSGIESITNTENENTSSYSVDYGDGTCDNLALVTENGKTSLIDFSTIYYQKVDSSGVSVPEMQARSGMKFKMTVR
jgi:hypothetical protein